VSPSLGKGGGRKRKRGEAPLKHPIDIDKEGRNNLWGVVGMKLRDKQRMMRGWWVGKDNIGGRRNI